MKKTEQNQTPGAPGKGLPRRYAGYFAVLLVVIVLVDILDNLATNIGGNITSSFITEFFVNGRVFGRSYAYEEGLALAGELEGVELLWIFPDGEIRFTPGLSERIIQENTN